MSAAAGSSTRSASSFPAALASRPAFSVQPSSETSHSDAVPRARSTSPTKRFLKTESLLGLAVPIQFIKEQTLGAAVPDDARPLLEALSAVEAGEALLPATQPASAAAAEYAAALHNHEQLRRIVDKSIASANKHRSEAGWNSLVHTPFLEHATLHMPHLEVEPITSAQTMPAFRPLLASGEQVPLPSSETSAAGSSVSGRSGLATPIRRGAAMTTSVHKMVDYALILRPSDALQALIDRFLGSEPWEKQSINQTRYEPLHAQPAPVFIETKTTSATQDSANVRLGWSQAGTEERLLTLPVIQVIGGVWSVLYVVDDGTHIRVLDDDCRIGNTNNIFILLMTTRSGHVAEEFAGADVIEVEQMDPKEATELFRKHLTRKKELQDEVLVAKLLSYLSFLPLAITQAASYLNQTKAPLTRYLTLLQDAEKDLPSVLGREFKDTTRYKDQVTEMRLPDTYRLYELVGRCHSIDRRFKEAAKCYEPVYWWKRAKLREDDGDLLYTEHELASAYLDDRRIKDAIEILEHVVAVRKETLDEKDQSRLTSEQALASAYLNDRRIEDAIEILEHVVAVRKETLDEKDQSRLASEHELASAYLDDRRIEDAIEILEHVVAVEKETLNEKDHERLTSEHELARAYRSRNIGTM
ncbi:hypothetical protein ARSEF4850_006091 [Beauveria asiatica]